MDETENVTPKASAEKPASPQRQGRRGGLELSDLELLFWLVVGFIIGVALEVTTPSAIVVVIVVLAAVIRLYLEGAHTNPRPSIGMAPLFLLGWGFGLFVRALVS